MTREELIAALERAEGPSRELDRAIADFVDPNIERFGVRLVMRDVGTLRETGDIRRDLVPPFTASIDAALTLVPKGLVMSLSNRVPGDDEAIVYGGNVYERGNAPTLPLALCIAALKARGGA